MNDVLITMAHFRHLRYCSRGVRDFFFRHELDYTDFLRNGISSKKLLHVSNNDAMVVKAVEVANGWEQ